jgi:hypothetical protein
MLARLATGPLAFLVAGVLDASAAWGAWARRELRLRAQRRLAR